MAAAKKGSRTGSSRSGGGQGSSKNGRSAKSKASEPAGSAVGQILAQAVLMTFFGRALLALAGLVVLTGVNLLFTRDRFDTFYLVCAIEIIAFVAVGWLRLLLRPDSD